ELVDAALGTPEHRQRGSRSDRSRGGCSRRGCILLLCMVTLIAHGAMFVVCCLPCVADSAEELHRWTQARQGQAHQHTSTPARESTYSGASSAVVVLLSIC